MMKTYKISAVSYLNSTPFIYGFENYKEIRNRIELTKDNPAVCAEKLKNGTVDIGLIPAAEYPNIPNRQIISDYCIGARGAVKTVLLVSDVPLEEIEVVLLDYQSRTSVNLVQVLAQNYWKIQPRFLPAEKGYETSISGTKAGVIIGDRCFQLPKNFRYTYDLAEQWYQFTNLPFTFAVWAANKPISQEFMRVFNTSCLFGIDHTDEVIRQFADNGFTNSARLKKYLENDISYNFDNEKRRAMNYFLEMKQKIKNS
jgi:chorismate dehydratase